MVKSHGMSSKKARYKKIQGGRGEDKIFAEKIEGFVCKTKGGINSL